MKRMMVAAVMSAMAFAAGAGNRPRVVVAAGGKPLALVDRAASLDNFDVYDMVVVGFK